MAFGYPVFLELSGRRGVVIGGSALAEEKAGGLREAGADVAVIAQEPSHGIEELARRGDISLVPRNYRAGDLEGAFIAVAATGDALLNAEIFAEAEARGVLLNSTDDPPHCRWIAPAIVRRGELVMAISTGGKAPALARRMRIQLEEQFGPEYGLLVDVLGEVRDEMLPRTLDFPTWAQRWQDALSPGLIALVREGKLPEARSLVRSAIEGKT